MDILKNTKYKVIINNNFGKMFHKTFLSFNFWKM